MLEFKSETPDESVHLDDRAIGQGRTERQLRRDIRMGALAGFALIACAAFIAFALALSWGTP